MVKGTRKTPVKAAKAKKTVRFDENRKVEETYSNEDYPRKRSHLTLEEYTQQTQSLDSNTENNPTFDTDILGRIATLHNHSANVLDDEETTKLNHSLRVNYGRRHLYPKYKRPLKNKQYLSKRVRKIRKASRVAPEGVELGGSRNPRKHVKQYSRKNYIN